MSWVLSLQSRHSLFHFSNSLHLIIKNISFQFNVLKHNDLLTLKRVALDLERSVKFKWDDSTFFYACKNFFTIIQGEPEECEDFHVSGFVNGIEC
jgi:hypothetical protein